MTLELKVAGMTCQHCVRAVTDAIHAVDARASVAVELAQGVVRVETAAPRAPIAAAVAGAGYQVAA